MATEPVVTIGTSKFEKVTFESSIGGGNKIAAFFAPSDSKEIKGILQICHGMAEHFGRYEKMISYLNSNGWHVCGMDMLGHGATYELNKDNDMPLGYFGSVRNSHLCILEDEKTFNKLVRVKFNVEENNIPMILYGHSMGSFVARVLYSMTDFSGFFKGFIFSSTKGYEPFVGTGILLSNICGLFGLKRRPGKLLNSIAFGAYNKRIPENKTRFDWISTDIKEVVDYMSDPHAAFMFTCRGFHDLFEIVNRIQLESTYKHSSEVPCMLTYGEEDPVGNYGKGPVAVAKKYSKNPKRKVVVKNYGPYRHEIQHEPQVREKYFEDILEFMNESVKVE